MKTTLSIIIGLILLCPGLVSGQTAAQQAKLDALEKEPLCQEVQQASLLYFQITGAQVKSFSNRAKSKAMLPIFEVSGGYVNSNIDEATRDYVQYPGELWLGKGANGNSFDVRAKLVWDLPKLMFNPEVLDVASLSGLMQGVLKEATRLYYMRRRLQVDLILNPPTDQATYLSKKMRLEELTSLIDAITGSWFSEQLAKQR
jgi:hypothetical protein